MESNKWNKVYIDVVTCEDNFEYGAVDKVFLKEEDCLKYIKEKNKNDGNSDFIGKDGLISDDVINDWGSTYWDIQTEIIN